jgi:Glycosyltransferase
MLSVIAKDLGIHHRDGPSWIEGLYNRLEELPDVEVAYCFPYGEGQNFIHGKIGKLNYYGFHKAIKNITKYDISVELQIKQALDEFKPDILHIFGTEFPHTLAAVKAFDNRARTVIHIQGLCSICAIHYYADLPDRIVNHFTIRDLLRRDNIQQARDKFHQRGTYEIEALKNVDHVMGRSDWDKACTTQINSNLHYHVCYETLRKEFYKHNWDIDKCRKYTIFISQAWYPLKGFHYLLQALPEVIKQFPTAHVYVAGPNICKVKTLRDRIHITSYGTYLNQLIKQYKLEEHITFTGLLGEREMCNYLLKSHVFVSASTVENLSNSLGEAMILGIPSIASNVGGINNIFTHKEDGYLYQHDAWYMLSYYICELFQNDELAVKFSESAKQHARRTYDANENNRTLLEIYHNIYEENNCETR